MYERSIVLLAIVFGGCTAEVAPEEAQEEETHGEAASALCKNALTPAEEKVALKLVDDICGDTWCEGDNDFAFSSLRCRLNAGKAPKSGHCTLELTIIPREDDPPRYRRSCTTSGFTGFPSLVTTSVNGYQALQPAFYDALSECINELESKLPR